MSAYLEADPHSRDIVFLDSYASERWETVLHYMVASSQQAGISQDAVHTLLQVGKTSEQIDIDSSSTRTPPLTPFPALASWNPPPSNHAATSF